jgi:hypothetical protein
MIALWTKRDLDIAETLTRRVRLLSIVQIKRIWWPQASSLRIVRRRLRRMATAGLIARTIVNVHPLLDVAEPLAVWVPGREEPDFRSVSEQAKTRWPLPSIPQELFYATRLAANLFGSSAGRLPELIQRDHDLLLGQVYAVFRTARPIEARGWVGEDTRPKAGYRIKDPDAFLLDAESKVTRVIESGGRYSARQIENFHEHCVQYGLPYELW